MPGLPGHLTEDEVDVATAGDRAKCLEDDLRVRLEDHERFVEEGERGVPAGCRADGVALCNEVIRCGSGEATGPVTDVNAALEDSEIRFCRDDGGLVQQNAGARGDQEECRGERCSERERTPCPPLRKLRYRDERHESGRMRVVDRVANFGQRRRDDLQLDASEHVLGFVLGRLVERIGHRQRRARASELDESDSAELAEPARQLTYDGGLGNGGQ